MAGDLERERVGRVGRGEERDAERAKALGRDEDGGEWGGFARHDGETVDYKAFSFRFFFFDERKF